MSFTASAEDNHPTDVGLGEATWQRAEVNSPHHPQPVPVVVAKSIPYVPDANRLQNLSIYLPFTAETSPLVGTRASSLPSSPDGSLLPRYLVHIHGGAWRDPQLTSASIEPTVAHAFVGVEHAAPIVAIASVNYAVSPFPTHPTLPYRSGTGADADRAREAVHPQHLSDVLRALDLLRSFGLTDDSYVLSGHSCGACLALQAVLKAPRDHGLGDVPDAPRPAALLGLNGLYELRALVAGLDASHAHLRDEYETLLINAFTTDKRVWDAASPARFDPADIEARRHAGQVPPLIVLDHSREDQLVPLNQQERLEATLTEVPGVQVVNGKRCVGEHQAPWVQGDIIWTSVRDVLGLLRGS